MHVENVKNTKYQRYNFLITLVCVCFFFFFDNSKKKKIHVFNKILLFNPNHVYTPPFK